MVTTLHGPHQNVQREGIAVLPSGSRTANIDSDDFRNTGAKGLHLTIDATAVGAGPPVASITVTIQGRDSTSGKYYTILASVAIAAVGTTVLKVYPGLTAAANAVANDLLPEYWRVSVTHANATAITYSIGASLHR